MIGCIKYRVAIRSNIIGTKYYCVEYRKWRYGCWWYADHSLQFTLKEAMAAKVLLENNQSLYHHFKPSERCAELKLIIG